MKVRVSYRQYCPVAKAAEVFADRWTPLIIRELLADCHHFNELERGLPGISRPLLAERLRRLATAGVVERQVDPEGRPKYYLTPAGLELQQVVDALGRWGARWILRDPLPSELDPALLLWRIRRRISHDLLPARRIVVQFDFHGARKQRAWLVVEPSGISVCLIDPGYDVDVLVTTDAVAFLRMWLGRITLGVAVAEHLIEFDGPPGLVRMFQRALMLSPFADTVRVDLKHTAAVRSANAAYASPLPIRGGAQGQGGAKRTT